MLVRCDDLGFEAPQQQVVVEARDGRCYRCDFAWRGGEVIGEADGRIKYVDPALRAGRSADAVVFEEKRREDAIREVRRAVLRFTWDDAWTGHRLEQALLAAGVPRLRKARPLTR